MKKIINVILNCIFAVLVVLAILVVVVMLSTKKNGVANVFGYMPFSIQTGSMEPTIMTGDLIFVKKIDTSKLEKDDVISFYAIEEGIKIIKTHRIVEIDDEGGVISYVTKGDNNDEIDAVAVAPGDVIGIYTDNKISKAGKVLDFFKSKYGFLFCIIVPLLIFFIYQLYTFIQLLIEEKYEKKRK